MAETMIDRVAKAIVETDHAAEGLTFTELSRAMARAAIKAMREPTTAMLSSARGYEDSMSESSIEALWEMLIDAALSEGGE